MTLVGAGGPYLRDLHSADFNRDGWPDLAFVYSSPDAGPESLYLLLQDSANPGTFLAPVIIGAWDQLYSLAVRDVNVDGALDLIVMEPGTMTTVFHGDNAGNFTQSTVWRIGEIAYYVDFADVDADGRLDFVVAGSWDDQIEFAFGR